MVRKDLLRSHRVRGKVAQPERNTVRVRRRKSARRGDASRGEGFHRSGPHASGKSCSVKLSIPADVIVGVRVKLIVVLVAPDFFGVILSFRVYRTRTPVILLAWDIWTALRQQDPFAARRRLPSEGPAACTRADDHEIVVLAVLHVEDSSANAALPYSPSKKKSSEPLVARDRYRVSQGLGNSNLESA
jgi:hypothetical protein